ncbi:MAG: hypothetical protein NTZ95_03395 [Candidatus Omnitrophica bacterium]|nr:hypothetical protein [Candidatus Omnitrophota bacterium]
MKNRKEHYIPTREFVRKFPKKIEDLTIRYNLSKSPKISYRTLRYYITKKLMPKSSTFDKKSHYEDSLDMYKRLFIIWYLMHFKRVPFEDVKKIINSPRIKKESEAILLLLNTRNFLNEIVKIGDVNKVLRKIGDEESDSPIWVEREDIFYVMKYLVRKDIEDFNKLMFDFDEYSTLSADDKHDLIRRIEFYKEFTKTIKTAMNRLRKLRTKYPELKTKLAMLGNI